LPDADTGEQVAGTALVAAVVGGVVVAGGDVAGGVVVGGEVTGGAVVGGTVVRAAVTGGALVVAGTAVVVVASDAFLEPAATAAMMMINRTTPTMTQNHHFL
jgi:hypothetical protein